MKITSLDKPALRVLREKIEAALAPVAAELDLTFRMGGIRYTTENCTVKIEVATKGEGGEAKDKYAVAFTREAKWFDLDPADLGKVVHAYGDTFTIVGLNTRARKNPVIIRRVKDGKTFKGRVADINRALGRKVTAPSLDTGGFDFGDDASHDD